MPNTPSQDLLGSLRSPSQVYLSREGREGIGTANRLPPKEPAPLLPKIAVLHALMLRCSADAGGVRNRCFLYKTIGGVTFMTFVVFIQGKNAARAKAGLRCWRGGCFRQGTPNRVSAAHCPRRTVPVDRRGATAHMAAL